MCVRRRGASERAQGRPRFRAFSRRLPLRRRPRVSGRPRSPAPPRPITEAFTRCDNSFPRIYDLLREPVIEDDGMEKRVKKGKK